MQDAVLAPGMQLWPEVGFAVGSAVGSVVVGSSEVEPDPLDPSVAEEVMTPPLSPQPEIRAPRSRP